MPSHEKPEKILFSKILECRNSSVHNWHRSFRIKSYINNGCVQMFSLRVPKIILCNLLKIVFVELLWGSAL